jgi:hypothetical protein
VEVLLRSEEQGDWNSEALCAKIEAVELEEGRKLAEIPTLPDMMEL